jgi:hypothetical protein
MMMSFVCVVHSVGVLEEPLTDCELSCSMERGVGFLGLSTSCTLIWMSHSPPSGMHKSP